MEKTKNLLWIVALIVLVILIGVVGFGYYKNATMHTAMMNAVCRFSVAPGRIR